MVLLATGEPLGAGPSCSLPASSFPAAKHEALDNFPMASVTKWFEKLASSVLGTVGDIYMIMGGYGITLLATCFILS